MSGGTPKKPGVLKKIVIDLGPVFTTEMLLFLILFLILLIFKFLLIAYYIYINHFLNLVFKLIL